jgi:hypothetical protein
LFESSNELNRFFGALARSDQNGAIAKFVAQLIGFSGWPRATS